MRLQKFLKFI